MIGICDNEKSRADILNVILSINQIKLQLKNKVKIFKISFFPFFNKSIFFIVGNTGRKRSASRT